MWKKKAYELILNIRTMLNWILFGSQVHTALHNEDQTKIQKSVCIPTFFFFFFFFFLIERNWYILKTRLGVPSIAGRLLKVIETCFIWSELRVPYSIAVHIGSAFTAIDSCEFPDKILKYEAEAPLVATDVCDHYQIALGLRRIRNQKLWFILKLFVHCRIHDDVIFTVILAHLWT